jgi:hypothetical protein
VLIKKIKTILHALLFFAVNGLSYKPGLVLEPSRSNYVMFAS